MSSAPTRTPRRYDNTLRRARAAETRARIVAAGAELLQDVPIRDWYLVTIRGVAERAGVNERTVYRHFANERALRDAVMHRLEQQAGVDLDDLALDDVAGVTGRILDQVADHPLDRHDTLDPTLADAKQRQHDALLRAVETAAADWPAEDRSIAAALFDVLWGVSTYERLVVDWDLGHDEAVRAVTWAMDLLETAVAAGRRPTSAGTATPRRGGSSRR